MNKSKLQEKLFFSYYGNIVQVWHYYIHTENGVLKLKVWTILAQAHILPFACIFMYY